MEVVNPLLANALGVLKQGNTEIAEKEFTKAVSACLAAFGEADIVTARTLAHLARVCRLQRKVNVAIQMYERILRIHEALPEPLNSDHAVALGELAALCEEGGSQGSADILRRRADVIMMELGARAQTAESSEDGSNSDSEEEEEKEEEEEEEEEEEKEEQEEEEEDGNTE